MSFSHSVQELVHASTDDRHAVAQWWRRIELGAVCEIVNGYPFESKFFNKHNGVPLIRIRDVTSGVSETRYNRDIPPGYWIEPGDLIVGMDGDFNVRTWSSERGLLNQRVCKLIADSKYVDPAFIAYVLPSYLALINTHTHSVTVKHLSSKTIQEIPIPLLPRAEQGRIVAKLDSVSARSRAARDELARIPLLIEHYKQAILEKAFTGASDPFSDVIESTFYGPRFARDVYVKNGTITLRTTDFDEAGNIVLRSPPSVQVSAKEQKKWKLIDGDLLVTRTGSIGKCALYTSNVGPALPSAYLIRVRLNKSLILPRYALFFLLSPSGQRQLGLGVTAVTQPNINAGVIERLRLPIPSLNTQKDIVSRIEAAMEWLSVVQREQGKASHLLDHLDQGLLAKAFRGKLVPQDPNDEPAAVLLERVRAGLAGAPKRGRKVSLRRRG